MQLFKKCKIIFFTFVLICIVLILFFDKTNKPSNAKLVNDSNIYLNANYQKVEYYRIKKGENLQCDYLSADGNSYLCDWYFSNSQEPMTGWILSHDIVFKTGDKINE